MKQLGARFLLIAAVGMLTMASCVFDKGEVVINDKVCVNIDVYETTGTFSTFTVCDQFKQVLEEKLAEYGKGKKDVKSIHMVAATIKVKDIKSHDWRLTGDVEIARQDDPNGAYDDGPEAITHFFRKRLSSFKGEPEDVKLERDGVKLVDRALKALTNEEDPRLILIINNESVEPVPSGTDPLDFELRVCVKFQFVIDLGHHDDGGHH